VVVVGLALDSDKPHDPVGGDRNLSDSGNRVMPSPWKGTGLRPGAGGP